MDYFSKPNFDIPLYEDLPQGVYEKFRFLDLKEASGTVKGVYTCFYFCSFCKGWIEGFPSQKRENTLDSHCLSGRRGVSETCVRCKKEISFSGILS